MLHASKASSYQKKERYVKQREVYPHVYDAARASQSDVGFVAGAKVRTTINDSIVFYFFFFFLHIFISVVVVVFVGGAVLFLFLFFSSIAQYYYAVRCRCVFELR